MLLLSAVETETYEQAAMLWDRGSTSRPLSTFRDQRRGLVDDDLKRDLASAHRSLAMKAIRAGDCAQARTHIKA